MNQPTKFTEPPEPASVPKKQKANTTVATPLTREDLIRRVLEGDPVTWASSPSAKIFPSPPGWPTSTTTPPDLSPIRAELVDLRARLLEMTSTVNKLIEKIGT